MTPIYILKADGCREVTNAEKSNLSGSPKNLQA
jgi:hypothetical protein